ncbi:DNA adenine methylase [Clostridium fungisolvens]|uniref:Site-specific DNA-methyltransferase (adenine-specific) n=1 Tax=Clostridium fungisolvens TaxID=1604897 RepID=A0A6V8SND9_9CLOT|nr:DNA adenine methylase [Clostridium fungisolvens]GFP76383.1 Modification methylase DpnIIA [Clostridium fungisolvens]
MGIRNNAKPFLKWAGGKTQLLEQFEDFYPSKLKEDKINTYIEPFIGGGAVFFNLQAKYNFDRIVINDINKILVITYKVIQNNVEDLIEKLEEFHDSYHSTDEMEFKEKFYYEKRELFNNLKIHVGVEEFSKNWIELAAIMIFLNKTCFNGLYRENKKGGFNVPFGKRRSAPILDEENLLEVNKALKDVIILNGDFTGVEEYINSETFIYIDPPYRPLSDTSSFNDYSKVEFNDESQIRLGKWVRRLAESKQVKVMLSNSDPKNIDENDNFFDELYEGFNIGRVKAVRNINSKGSGRGAINEIAVTTY